MEEPFDFENPWHSQVNLLGGFNCVGCDAFRAWNEEMTGLSPDDDADFLRRCVLAANNAKAAGWEALGGHHNFLCPSCATLRREMGLAATRPSDSSL
jgi:hypothetical protein